MPAADAGDTDGEGAPQGLSWSWELDLGALIDSIEAVLPGAVSSIAPSSDAPSSDADAPPRTPFLRRSFLRRPFLRSSFLRRTGLS